MPRQNLPLSQKKGLNKKPPHVITEYEHTGGFMLIKHLVQHGNSKAIVIDKTILQAAGLDDTTIFQIVVDSNSGITIQSVKPVNNKFEEAKKYVFSEYADLFKRLSDR